MTASPFAPGSVSLRSYPHDELGARARIAELCDQATLAVAHGFDGVMTSEHHGGFAGYLPNPVQLAGFLLDAMPDGWAAPCPMLVLLRPTALVVEEIAWLAARFPGRVGLGVAAGALPLDFELMQMSMDGLAARFADALASLAPALRGEPPVAALAADAAVAALADAPVPLLSAANSVTAARRAASAGAGLLFDSLATPERVRALVEAYRAAGGRGSCVLVRRAWVGEPPAGLFERQVGVYRSYAPAAAPTHWGADEMVTDTDAVAVAERLAAVAAAAGADALNVRVHVPGVSVTAARDQIARLGTDVLPSVRRSIEGESS